jgi:uncharacterized protein (TIGR02147 family)
MPKIFLHFFLAMRISAPVRRAELETSTTRRRSTPGPILVFDYLDYREFLKDSYQRNKSIDPKYSCRYIASKVGFKSASYFTQVLHGRTDMTPAMALRFAEFLKLEARESNYFELLVLYARSRSATERRCYLEQLATFRESKAHLVPPEHYEFYECWYHTAIRELLHIEPFTGDFNLLSRRLRPAVPVSKVRESIELLLRLGMIRQDGERMVRSDKLSTTTGEAVRAVQVDQFHTACLQLAQSTIDEMAREERNLSTLTVTLSPDAMQRVGQEIGDFRRRILSIAEADFDETEVYHLGIQFFPMTRRLQP